MIPLSPLVHTYVEGRSMVHMTSSAAYPDQLWPPTSYPSLRSAAPSGPARTPDTSFGVFALPIIKVGIC